MIVTKATGIRLATSPLRPADRRRPPRRDYQLPISGRKRPPSMSDCPGSLYTSHPPGTELIRVGEYPGVSALIGLHDFA